MKSQSRQHYPGMLLALAMVSLFGAGGCAPIARTPTEKTLVDQETLEGIVISYREMANVPNPEHVFLGKTDVRWLGGEKVSRPIDEDRLRLKAANLGANRVLVIPPLKDFAGPSRVIADTTVWYLRKDEQP